MTYDDPEAKKYTGPPEGADPKKKGMPQHPLASEHEAEHVQRLKSEDEMSEGEDHEYHVGDTRRRTPEDGGSPHG
jgi:hypothetical protein